MTRPTWDEYFLDIAEYASRRATCSRLHAGCILVNPENRVLSMGYNGAPAGMRHCDHSPVDDGILPEFGDMTDGHCNRAQHAERNAIAACAREGISVKGATAYVTGTPCLDCARMLVSAGITKVIFRHTYHNASMQAVTDFFEEAGIDWLFHPCDPEVCGYEYCPEKSTEGSVRS